MNKTYIIILLFGIILSIPSSAQNMTFNHDPVVMNQFMKAEVGTGTLGVGGFWADQYYNILHKSYRNMANTPTNNKLINRMKTYGEVNKQEGYSEQIKDSLKKRADIEALNVADRQIDAEWIVEKEKLERQLGIFEKNIRDIRYYGGSSEDKTSWDEILSMVKEGINAAHDAYMPNAQRKAVYLMYYQDISKYNLTLIKLKMIWSARQQARETAKKKTTFVKNRSLVQSSLGRWKIAWSGKKNQ